MRIQQMRIGDVLQEMAREIGLPLQALMELSSIQLLAIREMQKRREAGAR